MGPVALASLSMVVAFFFIVGGFNAIRRHDHLKVAALIIPVVAIYAAIWCLALAAPTSVLITAESILTALAALYFIGPFRVSGWVWPGGGRLKTPRRVFTVLVTLTAAVTITVGGFALYTTGLFDTFLVPPEGLQWYLWVGELLPLFAYIAMILIVLAAVAAPSFGALWSIYFLVTSCFSFDKEEKKGTVADNWIDRNGSHIVVFDSDTNGYHVSPKLYEQLTEHNKGARYSYTVVTGLGGRQFIRTPPVLLPSTPQNEYSAYGSAEDSPAPVSAHSADIPAARLLGGDGTAEMDIQALENPL